MTLRRASRLHTRTDSLYADWYIYADETQVDVANNRSYVSVSMAIFCSAGYSFTSDGVSCGLTGSAGGSYGHKTWSGETSITSGGFWVNHDDKGEAAAHIYYWGNTTWGSGCSGDFWLGLTTIARASQPSISPSTISAGSSCTIYTNRASGSFSHTIQYSFGNKSGTIATGVGDSCSWMPSTDLLSQIPYSQSGNGTITCTTYSGSTNIGTKTCSFTLSIPSGSNPSVGSISLTEQHSGVKVKSDSITVQQLSKKLVSVAVSAKYHASIKSVVCDGVTLSESGGTYTGYVSNKMSGTYTVTATDSRGLQSSNSIAQTFYAYSRPYIVSSLKRNAEIDPNGSLTVSGTYSTILSNTISMTIQRNDESSATAVTPSLSSGKISFTKEYTDLYYVSSFSITVVITDSFGERSSTTAHLGIGQYAFAMIKQGVVLGPDSYLFDKQSVMRSVLDFFYPVGTIYTTEDKDFNPSARWGGTWELIKDRMIIGAGNSYAVKSTGGSSSHNHSTGSHTLTDNEIPSHNHGIYRSGFNEAGRSDWGLVGGGAFAGAVLMTRGNWTATLNSGGSSSHSHGNTGSSSSLPPYYSAYIWRRTA